MPTRSNGILTGSRYSRHEAREDVVDYIEIFYIQTRHSRKGMLSPVMFEKQQKT